MICAPETVETLSCFKVNTDRGTTFVVPLISKKCCQPDYQCTCALENSEIVRLIAQKHQVLGTRYISDSVRPVLLVEVD